MTSPSTRSETINDVLMKFNLQNKSLTNESIYNKQVILKENYKALFLDAKSNLKEIKLEIQLDSTEEKLETELSKQENLFKLMFHKSSTPYVGVVTKETNCSSSSAPTKKKLKQENKSFNYWFMSLGKRGDTPSCDTPTNFKYNSCLMFYFHEKTKSLHKINIITQRNMGCDKFLLSYIDGLK